MITGAYFSGSQSSLQAEQAECLRIGRNSLIAVMTRDQQPLESLAPEAVHGGAKPWESPSVPRWQTERGFSSSVAIWSVRIANTERLDK